MGISCSNFLKNYSKKIIVKSIKIIWLHNTLYKAEENY